MSLMMGLLSDGRGRWSFWRVLVSVSPHEGGGLGSRSGQKGRWVPEQLLSKLPFCHAGQAVTPEGVVADLHLPFILAGDVDVCRPHPGRSRAHSEQAEVQHRNLHGLQTDY